MKLSKLTPQWQPSSPVSSWTSYKSSHSLQDDPSVDSGAIVGFSITRSSWSPPVSSHEPSQELKLPPIRDLFDTVHHDQRGAHDFHASKQTLRPSTLDLRNSKRARTASSFHTASSSSVYEQHSQPRQTASDPVAIQQSAPEAVTKAKGSPHESSGNPTLHPLATTNSIGYEHISMQCSRSLPSIDTLSLPRSHSNSPIDQYDQWQYHQHHISPYTTSVCANQTVEKYICTQCNKAFSRPSSLKIHGHSHTGEKPFKCSIPACGKRFNVRSNMKRHERGCHSNQEI